MATPLPDALKIPDVSRFVNRANQLRTIKPAIAYWCEYHAVNQIVGKGLHNTGDDAFAFTKTLIDRLEATKVEHDDDDSIVDNEAAKAYVEQFAQQTFDRAERTMRANKVTRQTADTFDASATFFDLLREWGELEPEISQKIKFAKWNAARILKAFREGNDPNETNPNQAQESEAEGINQASDTQLDPNDPDVQQITSGGVVPQPASVQDVQDAGEPLPAASTPPEVSPAEAEYFPEVPRGPASSHSVEAPSIPTPLPDIPPEAPAASQIPPQPSPQIPTKLPSQFAPPPIPPQQPAVSAPVPAPTMPASQPAPPPAVAPAHDYKDLNKAQKHAKFAISALNFEDVPTAVQELRNALAALGTQ